jgi:hypothetical protein
VQERESGPDHRRRGIGGDKVLKTFLSIVDDLRSSLHY